MKAVKFSFHRIKNIGLISTRIAGTDGVSLEVQKWADVLERNRYNCFYFAGSLDTPKKRSFLVKEAHFDYPSIQEITRRLSENKLIGPFSRKEF